MLQEEASERPYETVEPLAKRLGMIPQEGERMPKQGGNLVFDNRFEAEEHKVTHPDTGSCGALYAGIFQIVRIRGWANRDEMLVGAQSMLPVLASSGLCTLEAGQTGRR